MPGNECSVPLGLEVLSELRCLPGSLTVFAARPGQGKTAMLLQIAASAANAGWKVAFFSLEVNEKDLTRRLLAVRERLPLREVIAPQDTRLVRPLGRLQELGVRVYDGNDADHQNQRVESVVSACKKLKGATAVVFVDYLQILSAEREPERRYELLGKICRTLKLAALNNDLPIIAAAQLGRGVEGRSADSPPRLSDLRESGDIEATADNVCLISHKPDRVHLEVAKQRMGPTFGGDVRWIPEQTRFEDFGWQ